MRSFGDDDLTPPLLRAGIAAVVTTMAILGYLLYGIVDHQPGHPAPRPGAGTVALQVPVAHLGNARVEEAYRMASEVPETLDGLRCHCGCYERLGHRSVLACFETGHAAESDICVLEASLAYRLTLEGRSLREVRRAVDRWFGG